jgi:hypothetical protein
MTEHRFSVFGHRVAIRARPGGGWDAFALGDEGKRRPADFVVPDFVAAEDLAQYLFDLFHESAGRGDGRVTRLP